MKRVLFIGDGEHDIGKPDWPTDDPYPAGGVVPRLAERVAPIDRANSLAFHWAHPRLARFPAARRTRGYESKIRAAQLQLERGPLAHLEGLVCVVDEDNDPTRRDLPTTAHALATPACPIACGVAVRSIEAWTLGAPAALADVLGLPLDALRRTCGPTPPEHFYASSGKPELRSKDLLKRLDAHARPIREDIADRTDPAALARTCPEGFAPFAAALRAAFGGPPHHLSLTRSRGPARGRRGPGPRLTESEPPRSRPRRPGRAHA